MSWLVRHIHFLLFLHATWWTKILFRCVLTEIRRWRKNHHLGELIIASILPSLKFCAPLRFESYWLVTDTSSVTLFSYVDQYHNESPFSSHCRSSLVFMWYRHCFLSCGPRRRSTLRSCSACQDSLWWVIETFGDRFRFRLFMPKLYIESIGLLDQIVRV